MVSSTELLTTYASTYYDEDAWNILEIFQIILFLLNTFKIVIAIHNELFQNITFYYMAL